MLFLLLSLAAVLLLTLLILALARDNARLRRELVAQSLQAIKGRHALHRIQEEWAKNGPLERERDALVGSLVARCRMVLGGVTDWDHQACKIDELIRELDRLRR